MGAQETWGQSLFFGSIAAVTDPVTPVPVPDCGATWCCQNGGTVSLTASNVCECTCATGFTGIYCQDALVRKELAKYTYEDGENEDWYISMSSRINEKRHVLKKALYRRNFNNDQYDMFTTFEVRKPDDPLEFIITFEGPEKIILHSLKGQLGTLMDDSSVTVCVFNGNTMVSTEVIPLVGGGYYPRLEYQDFFIMVAQDGVEVTHIVLKFSKPCECLGCYGINGIFGEYSEVIPGDLNCTDTICDDNAIPTFENGCCNCPPPTTTPPATTTTPMPSCDTTLDIALILDKSTSIGRDYPLLKNRTKQLLNFFTIGPNDVNVGAVVYSSDAVFGFPIGNHTNRADLDTAIDALPGTDGRTNIAGGIELAINQLLIPPGDRPNVPNVCLLVTDGAANIRENETEIVAAHARQKCNLITVGIGNVIDPIQLANISSTGEVIQADNVDGLAAILEELVVTVCSFGM